MPLPTGAIIGIGGASAGANLAGAGWTNHTNRKIAEENRAWQEHMASTRYQRMKADMLEAGYNPLLGVTGKADAGGIPQGNQATVTNPLQAMSGIANLILQVSNQKHKNNLMDAQSTKATAESSLPTSTISLNKILEGLHLSATNMNNAKTGLLDKSSKEVEARINEINKHIEVLGQELNKKIFENVKAGKESGFWNSKAGTLKMYTDKLLETAQNGADLYATVKNPMVHQALNDIKQSENDRKARKDIRDFNYKKEQDNKTHKTNRYYYDKNGELKGGYNEEKY